MPDREKVIKGLEHCLKSVCKGCPYDYVCSEDDTLTSNTMIKDVLELLKEQETDQGKYEHHIDHTDCVWYKPEEGNECPATCSQYRDGWNDAMDYIFKDGRGYRPYVRG